MPSPERPWTADDDERTVQVLTRIKKDKSLPLPRFGDEPSGKLFDRMVNPENLALIRDKTVPMPTRMGEAMAMSGMIKPMMFAYYNLELKAQPHGRECLELMGFRMSIFATLIETANQFLETLTEQQRSEPARKQGLDRMKMGVATSVLASLVILSETDQYSRDDLRDFARKLPDRILPLWGFITPLNRQEFRTKIGQLTRTHPDETVRLTLEILAKTLPPEPDEARPSAPIIPNDPPR